MIPGHDKQGDLVAGVWHATWTEIEERFCINVRRTRLLTNFKPAVLALRDAGCRRMYIGGSFITTKMFPEDIDAAWDTEGVRIDDLKDAHLEFFKLAPPRAEQHLLYGADLMMVDSVAQTYPRILYLEWLQKKRWSGKGKGVLLISLEVGDDWYGA